MDKIIIIGIACNVLAILLAGYIVKGYYDLEDEYEGRLQSYTMCNSTLQQAQFGINGIYFVDKYYCVWTEGRTEEDIDETNSHEVCHALINEEHSHFCGGAQ